MKNEHLIVNNLDIQYEEHGSGPVIIFLHGWGTSSATFDELILAWGNQNKRFITLDLPGFGGSESPPTAWNVSTYASFVQDFLKKIDAEKPYVIIGHSFGGRIAIKGVSEGNFKSDYLVLIASAGTAKTYSSRKTLFMIIAKIGKIFFSIPPFSFFKEKLQKKLYVAAGSSDYLNAGDMKKTFLKIIQENLIKNARMINIPTLLVWGENDTITPLAEAQILHSAIKGSKLNIIANAGHFVYKEKPKEVAKSISTFTNL